MKKILWIEDEAYTIKGLFRPLEKDGFDVEVAESATDAYHYLQDWQRYDLIVSDLIIPISNQEEDIPITVLDWQKEIYVGVGLVKWLLLAKKVLSPVVILSVNRPFENDELEKIGLAGYISKRGLLPSQLHKRILDFLDLPTL